MPLYSRTALFTALVAVVSLVYTVSWLRRVRQRRIFARARGCVEPPHYKHADPLFGLLEMVDMIKAGKSHTFLERIQNLYDKYGNTFVSSPIFGTRTVNTIEPESLESILSSDFQSFAVSTFRKPAMLPFLGDKSIVVLDGHEWKKVRTMYRHGLERDSSQDCARFETYFQQLIQVLPKDGSPVNLIRPFFTLAGDITLDFMFGQEGNTFKRPVEDQDQFYASLQRVQLGCEERYRLGWLADLVPMKDFKRSVKVIHQFLQQHVESALRLGRASDKSGESVTKDPSSSKRRNMLEILAGVSSDRVAIRTGLADILVGGRDTTASLLTDLFFEISKRPDVWKKIREEVSELDGKLPGSKDLSSLTYVKWCIQESLRLHPIVALNSRVASKDTVLPVGGGLDGRSPVFVPQGSIVAFHTPALHRRKDLWGEDADVFNPERWSRETPAGYAYLAFLAGPRRCPGQSLAMAEASFTVIRFAQEFRYLQSRDDRPWTEKLGITCCSANGALVSLVPESSKDTKVVE